MSNEGTRLGTVLWERKDRIGLEDCRLDAVAAGFRLSGVALYRGRGGPTRAVYRIEADGDWHTREVDLRIEDHTGTLSFCLTADGQGHWMLDGKPLPAADGCLDVDLAFTPSTNTLAIRRLGLDVGGSAEAQVLWVPVPSLKARVVTQTYERVDRSTYRYRTRYGSYAITTDAEGLVLDYPGGGWHGVSHKGRKHRAAR
ncbi:putative glycolipid-binding domain-containing protein [Streptomyces griseoincarnatus]